jgi:hypothetical protein
MDINEQKMREIAQEVVFENTNSSQFAMSPVPFHTHNGLDSNQVSAVNLIYNDKLLTGIIAENETTKFTINLGIANPTSIQAFGIARNNLAGAAIKKTVINGNSQLGNCFKQSAISVPPDQLNIVQVCSGTFFDNTTAAWVPTVFVDSRYLAFGDPNNISTTAYIQVLSYDNTSITFQVFAAADWRLTVNLIIT